MDSATVALICILVILGVYLLGFCFTCCCLQRHERKTGTLGDGLSPFFHISMSVCWPCLLVGGVCNCVREQCERPEEPV